MIPVLLGAAIFLGGAVLAVNWWDELRSAAYRWLEEHGHHRMARAFVVIEGAVSGTLRRAKALVFPEPSAGPVVVTETVVSEDELSPEARARRERLVYEL